MNTCIYCLQSEPYTTFSAREHVIPQSLGTFNPQTPVLEKSVCNSCNNSFSKLETKFREDTFEGVLGQRLNFQNQNSVVVRNKCLKINHLTRFNDPIFARAFFLLKPENGRFKPILKPHITFKMRNGGFRMFLVEALEKIKIGNEKFKRIKKDIRNLSQEDIWVFVPNDGESMQKAKKILNDYGIRYQERATAVAGDSEPEMVEVIEDYEGTVDKDIFRVLAKIAFNYLAFCAEKEGMTSELLSSNFDSLRNLILKGEGYGTNFVEPEDNRILGEELGTNSRLLGHTVCFMQENGKIYCRLMLFGFKSYKVLLGETPIRFRNALFGCGHVFDPLGQRIHNIALNNGPILPNALDVSFGLFKLFR